MTLRLSAAALLASAISAMLAIQSAVWAQPASRAAAPELEAWLDVYNHRDAAAMEAFAQERYQQAWLAQTSPRQLAINYRNTFANYGPFRLVEWAAKSELSAEAVAYAPELDACIGVFVEIDRAAPSRIEGVYFEPFNRRRCPERMEAPTSWRDFSLTLGRYLDALAASDRFHGVVLVRRGGETVLHEARGAASLSPARPNTRETRFELASISKLFTTVALARLAETNVLSWDDTVAHLLPDYPNDAVALRIAVRQLLAHTSGLEDYYQNGAIFADPRERRRIEDYWPLFAAAPLTFEPGSRYDYSNSNFIVLGSIVERVSGEAFETFVAREVFSRARMTRTCYCRPGAADIATPLSVYTAGAGRGRRVSPAGSTQIPADSPRPALPAGYSVSSARDLARFAESLLGGRLLQKSTLDRLLTPEIAMDNGAQRALGFEVDNIDGVRLISHGGNSWGVSTQLDIYPEAGVVVVILSNSETSGAAALTYKSRRWLAALARR